MPTNKVLLPIQDTKGYGSAANNNWSRINNGNLGNIAEDIVIAANAPLSEDYAIPSPIAHVKHFKSRLFATTCVAANAANPTPAEVKMKEASQAAFNEWCGMLAILAMQDILALDITVKQIPIYNQQRSSSLGQAFYNELIANSSITGYRVDTKVQPPKPNCEHLNVFCVKKNNREIPFAMYMPSMLICPFKSYPLDIFDGIEWYDSSTAVLNDPNKDPKATWKPLTTCRIIDDGNATLTRTAIGLITWIEEIYNNISNATDLRDILDKFKNALVNGKPDNSQTRVQLESADYSNIKELPSPLTKKIKSKKVRFFSDSLLAIIPPNGFDNNQIGDALIKVAENGKDYYIVPPIHKDLVCEIRDGNAKIETLNITVNKDETNKISSYLCEIKVKNLPGGDIVTKSHTFNEAEIAYTECMPYISMWPFVNFENDSWTQHYVAIVANDKSEDAADKSEDAAQSNENTLVRDDFKFFFNSSFRHLRRRVDVTDEKIEFTLVAKKPDAKIDTYAATAKYRNDGNGQPQKITMLSSDSTPYALEFSYTDSMGQKHTLGIWTINRDDARTVSGNSNTLKTVAMDFGTTGTNIYIADNPIGDNDQKYLQRSIYSPGKYVRDIYCPLNEAERKFIQKYYLFSDRSDLLGKVFTYGQYFFESSLNGKDCSDNTISNVTGRLIEIDKDFISDSNASFGPDCGIETGLKWPEKDNAVNSSKEKARQNFILNVLTYGVLDAKIEGANRIEVRVSYPSKKFGNTVLNDINKIKPTLSTVSGINNIEILGQTEAKSAGKYFEKSPNVEFKPTPGDGYAIIDIGGGTTDFSFWKGDKIPELKSEHSFRYAGNYLVEKSIIQTVKDLESFKKLWGIDEQTSKSEIESAKNYINSSPSQIYRKIAIIDFLLENKGINYTKLGNEEFDKLCFAVCAKYYGLFYLIASYMKNKLDKKEIELSPYTFRICMAGCGAKGLSIAGKRVNITEKIESLFRTVLDLDDGLNFHIALSTCDNKEEVVIGLTLLDKAEMDTFGTASNSSTKKLKIRGSTLTSSSSDDGASSAQTTTENDTPAIVFTPPKRDELMVAFSELLGYLDSLGLKIEAFANITDKNEIELNNNAIDVFMNEFGLIGTAMEDVNYDPDTYKEFFSLMMLEKMIEKLI